MPSGSEKTRYLDKNPVEMDDERLPDDYQHYLDNDEAYQKWADEIDRLTRIHQEEEDDAAATETHAPF